MVPLATYSSSLAAPSCEKAAQCEHVWLAYSISLSGAFGLPITNPPSGVSAAVSTQLCPAGAAIGAIGSPLIGPSASEPQAARASASGAARAVRRVRRYVDIGDSF